MPNTKEKFMTSVSDSKTTPRNAVMNVDDELVDLDNPYPESGGVGKLVLQPDGQTIVWPKKLRGRKVAPFNPKDVDEIPSNAGEWIVDEEGIIQNPNTGWQGYPLPTVNPDGSYGPAYKVVKKS